MSIVLVVDWTSAVALEHVASGVPPILRKLLGVSSVPTVELAALKAGVSLPVQGTEDVGERDAGWTLRLSGHSGCAFFGPADISDPSSTGGVRRWVWVNASAWRSPLEYALVAAVAVVLAEAQESDIKDDSRFYTTDLVIDRRTFLERTSAQRLVADIEAAADEFYMRLFRSGFPD